MSPFKVTPEHAENMNGLCLVPIHLHPFIMPWLQHSSGVRHGIGSFPMTASSQHPLASDTNPTLWYSEEIHDDDNSPVSGG